MAGKTIHKSPMKGSRVVGLHNLRQTFMIFTEGQTEEGNFKKVKLRCKTVTTVYELVELLKNNLLGNYGSY